jgi:hypothetical protein
VLSFSHQAVSRGGERPTTIEAGGRGREIRGEMATTARLGLISPGSVARAIAILALPILLAACLPTTVSTYTLTTYTSADGRFHVDVPGGVMTDAILPSSGVFAGATVHGLSVTADRLRFAVVYGDAEASYLATTPIDTALGNAVSGNVASTHGTLSEQHAITLAGSPAREARVAIIGGEYLFVVTFVGNRLYSLSVLGTDDTAVRGSEATQFLNSFAVTP